MFLSDTSFALVSNKGRNKHSLKVTYDSTDRLCELVARVPGYRSRGPGSIPGATRFSEK
jgi:hypothetical protein